METTRIKEILKDCRTEGNFMYLGNQRITDYADFKKSIISMGAVYRRNKFEFPLSAEIVLNALLSTSGNFQKDFQFFATPEAAIIEMMGVYADYPLRVLEPQAGQGAFIEYMMNDSRFTDSDICYCEISEYNQQIIKGKNLKANFLTDDFLSLSTDQKFDLIVSNPPFNKNQYVTHTLKGLQHLTEEGVLLVILPQNWKDNAKLSLSGYEVHSWDFPRATFAESKTMVATSYLYITKTN